MKRKRYTEEQVIGRLKVTGASSGRKHLSVSKLNPPSTRKPSFCKRVGAKISDASLSTTRISRRTADSGHCKPSLTLLGDAVRIAKPQDPAIRVIQGGRRSLRLFSGFQN